MNVQVLEESYVGLPRGKYSDCILITNGINLSSIKQDKHN